jgi:acriflavin resistance protein
VSSSALNAALYNAFGQRQIATLYADLNQYAIVMEWLPRLAQSPLALQDVRVPSSFSASASAPANPGLRDASTGQSLSTSARTLVPLTSFASYAERAVPTSVQHDGGELSSTLSFNLADGVSLQAAQEAVREAENAIGMPDSVRGQFAGNAAQMQQQQSEQMWLVIAAVVVIYLVLGILYESLVHPLTVLTTLPSAGFGAVLALLAMKMEFTIMALIGVFLLIGIVKKNAILVIDFALSAERERGLDARSAVREACLKRLRPILMTTLAAGLGALPLAIGFGQGAELRQPLGVTIIGGLLASQFMTLLTTPAIYVLLDGLRQRVAGRKKPDACN